MVNASEGEHPRVTRVTTMKKRFLIPLLAVAAPLAIGIADAAIHNIGCGIGNQGACTELARRQQHSKELDAKHAKQVAKAEDRAATREIIRAANAAVPSTAISQEQFIGCEVLLQRTLNDPDSYKRLNTPKDAMATGVLRYTATNAFNGRVQATHSCNA
jgi:hypothetical protein